MRKSASCPESGAARPRSSRRRAPILSGTTIGTWRVLYEAEDESRRYCMCRCVRCGVRKMILVFKIRKRYALKCRDCRIREELEHGPSPVARREGA